MSQRAVHRSFVVAMASLSLLVVRCGSNEESPTNSNDGGPASSDGNAPRDDGSVTSDSGAGGDGGIPTSCDDFGQFGVPTNTFTLPSGQASISYTDIQASFPAVDWTTLERLYIPAGKYKTILIQNLPIRDASKPLVITNLGGQVQVGPNLGGNFLWSINGGSNWILTGRYDETSKTGDAAFAGHRCGAYADSRGKYGFLSDDALDHSGPYTHMGLSVGDATDFELEYLEITRSGFAGIRLLNATNTTKAMKNVRVHDTYVHDIDSEGLYFGWTGAPPSNLLENLQIYNNRILRTGSETLQIQDLGAGSHVHHNVFAFGALHWLDNFAAYQDGCLQILARQGQVEFDHNVSMGGAGTFLSFFSSPQTGDGARNVTFHDNYFADTRSLGGYLNGNSAAGSSFTFQNNFFRGLDFSYTTVNPGATDPGVVFGINGANLAPITFDQNTIEGTKKLTYTIALNGTNANVTATNNVNAAVAPVAYVASGYPNVPTSKLSAWGTTATLAPGTPPIQYAVGDLVTYQADLYRAKTANTGLTPPEHLDAWEKLPLPTDDVRITQDSPYATFGIH